MLRGFYTAASGMVTQEKKLNAYANNITNANTAGYKKDNLVAGTFGEHLINRMNAYQEGGRTPVGPGVFMQVVDEKYTVFSQGGFEQTGRPLDMALQGDGMFVVQDAQGEQYLTRDGQFSIDEEGYLMLPGFGRVQGENGDIELATSDIGVDGIGNIYVAEEDEDEPTLVDRLLIAIPDDYTALEKAANGLYTPGEFVLATDETPDVMVRQSWVERSNVNMAEEMTRIISSQRSLQSCSQIVKMYDELAEQTNQKVSHV